MINPNELMATLTAQAASKKDYIAPAAKFAMTDDAGLQMNGFDAMPIRDTAHLQIAEYTGITARYYKRCLAEKPALLATNVNAWLTEKNGDKRMVRTLEGVVRAVLSPRYRPLDHYDLIKHAIPVLQALGALPFRAHLSETRMHASFAKQDMFAEIFPNGYNRPAVGGVEFDDPTRGGHGGIVDRKVHKIIAACTLQNSETGHGGQNVLASIIVAICQNLTVWEQGIFKVHIGRSWDIDSDDVSDLISDEARAAEDAAHWLKVRDMITATFTEAVFMDRIAKMQKTREVEIDEPIQILKNIADREGFNEDSLLMAFMAEPEPTAFGICQALTLAAQTVKSDDDQVALSKIAGQITAADGTDAMMKLMKDSKTKLNTERVLVTV